MSREPGSISARYRRRLATNSNRSPPSDTFNAGGGPASPPAKRVPGPPVSTKSDMPCDLQPYYSGEELHGLEQQSERPAKPCQKRTSLPSVAVAILEECVRREEGISQPTPLLQPWLCDEQEQMTEFGNRLVRHKLLEKPIPKPFTEGRGSKAFKHMIRNGDSGVSRHHKGEAMIDRNFEMASESLVHDEVPIHVLFSDK